MASNSSWPAVSHSISRTSSPLALKKQNKNKQDWTGLIYQSRSLFEICKKVWSNRLISRDFKLKTCQSDRSSKEITQLVDCNFRKMARNDGITNLIRLPYLSLQPLNCLKIRYAYIIIFTNHQLPKIHTS